MIKPARPPIGSHRTCRAARLRDSSCGANIRFSFPIVFPFVLPAALGLRGAGVERARGARRRRIRWSFPASGPTEMARAVRAGRSNGREAGPGRLWRRLHRLLVTGYTGGGARYNAPGQARPRAYGVPAGARLCACAAHGRLGPADPVEAEPREVVDGQFRRQEVAYDGRERPGTIIIDTPNKFLFLVQPNGRALRYGIGVGRPGFEWSGVKTISRKAEWPGWTPPPEMMLRRPDLPDHMDGGPGNPLGARALYLGSSMYRIHGTNEPCDDRQECFVRLHPHDERGRHRSLQPRAGRHEGHRHLTYQIRPHPASDRNGRGGERTGAGRLASRRGGPFLSQRQVS